MRAVLLLGLTLVSCSSFQELVHTGDLEELEPGAPGYDSTVQVRYLGVSGLSIRLGADHLVTAPFYSNPGLGRVLLGSIEPRTDLILEFAPPLEDVQAVLVGHSHYDHLMDLPVLARERLPDDCVIYGSQTTAHILAAAKLAQKIEVVNDDAGDYHRAGRWLPTRSGRMRIMALRSDHAPHFIGVRAYDGVYSEDLAELPTSAGGWVLGVPFAYLIDFLDDKGERSVFRIYYQDAAADPPAGLPPSLKDGKAIDLAILCAASFSQLDHHPEAVIAATRPRFVLATHWEDFFRPQTEPLSPVTGTDPEEFLRRLEKVLPDGSAYWMPAPGTLFQFRIAE